MRRSAVIGAIVGLLFGIVMSIGYAGASIFLCYQERACPDHWLPFALVFLIGLTIAAIIGTVVALVLRLAFIATRV
ncbi:MAG: hypothetical protein WD208_08125 [Dehalococcoidia bacterium]